MICGMWLYNDKPVEAEPVKAMTEIQTEAVTIEIPTEAPTETSVSSSIISPIGEEFDQWLYQYCSDKEISPYLVLAIIEYESDYDALVIGDQGKSYGLMQIQIRFHADRMAKYGYTASDMLQPIPNVIVGVDYLLELISKGNGIEWALSAFNGGERYAWNNADSPTRYATEIIARAQELAFYD
ncbi:transglycosylase SLT domain-containing protein [Parasporobacterium paucivorans]|uniref:Transglycosylase SLT domain-containing protein n=1 Tax=Parasporobacterium paucivorans DSM 15970 TaxID=1122934 RepID=A0A1M6B783_9FIRM|nr:transglycosylase SLT domain-containing protein [Parasporobacterium paucivorans]SHI44517.1 Transglycosylase SLT domain-containing protein [Parasporobacterium paucivorans DSM 15970]